jgi:hypothetical protein
MAVYLADHHLGAGAGKASLDRVLELTLWFAAIPALLSGGGVARLAAHRAADHADTDGQPSLRHAVLAAASSMAAAGLGLGLLVAVPLGGLPEQPLSWLPMFATSLVAGAVTGAAIGVLVGARGRRWQRATAAQPQAQP